MDEIFFGKAEPRLRQRRRLSETLLYRFSTVSVFQVC